VIRAARTTARLLLAIAATVPAACGGSATTSPATVSSFTSGNWTISGNVVSTIDGAPVAFARLSLSQQSLTTNDTGAFLFNGLGAFLTQSL
jgi:hypothetical protein